MTEPLDTHDEHGDYDWDYDDEEDRGPRPKILWGRVISLVVFMLIAFLIGRWSVGGPSQAEYDSLASEKETLEDENTELTERNTELRALVQNATAEDGEEADPAEEETDGEQTGESEAIQAEEVKVQPGDTLSGMVKKHYGCTVAINDEKNEIDLTEAAISTNETAATAEGEVFEATELAAGQIILMPPLPTGYECA